MNYYNARYEATMPLNGRYAPSRKRKVGNMKRITLVLSAVAASMLLVAGLTGCAASNAPASSNPSNTSSSAAASASENASSASNTSSASSASVASAKDTSNTSSASNASSASTGSSFEGRGNAEPTYDSKKVGRSKTGYVLVPVDWIDRTDQDFKPQQIDASAVTYVVDPTTEYTSAALSHFAYSSSIQLETFPTSYTDKADEYLYDYRGDTENYSDVTIEKDKFSGHDASVVSCKSIDGVNVTHIVFDKNDDGHSCVAITVYGTQSTNDAVLSYVATWTAS